MKKLFFNWFLLIIRLRISISKLKFKIILKIDPAKSCLLLAPKYGFNTKPNNKRIYAEIVEWKEDNTLNPKILSFGSLNE